MGAFIDYNYKSGSSIKMLLIASEILALRQGYFMCFRQLRVKEISEHNLEET